MPQFTPGQMAFIQRLVRVGTFLDPNIDDLARIKLAKLASAINVQSADYTLLETDYRVDMDTSGGPLALTMLPAVTKQGVFLIRNTGGNTLTVSPDPTLPDTIEGASSLALASQDEYVMLVSDGVSDWTIFSHGIGGSTGGLLAGNVSGLPDANLVNVLGALTTSIFPSGTHTLDRTNCVCVSSGTPTFDLPAASDGQIAYFFVAQYGNSFTVNTNGTDTFQGIAGLYTLSGSSKDFIVAISDGVSNWNIVSQSRLPVDGDATGTLNNITVIKINGIAYNANPLTQYALLDGSNQPFTGDVVIYKTNPTLTLVDDNTTALTRESTDNEAKLQNDVFVASSVPLIDYLLVGGGGGGAAGGGGAGGIYEGSGVSVTISTYPVVIGAGGASKTISNSGGNGNDGNDSTFNGKTAAKGGAGAGINSGNGHAGGNGDAGGSGGGGGSTNPGSSTGGAAGTGGSLAHAGGAFGGNNPNYSSGGGGGAAAVGSDGVNGGTSGAGGAGYLWHGVTYGGGGGGSNYGGALGGAGGTGGGGAGDSAGTGGHAGTDGLGGGGGGTGNGLNSGKGGNGTLVVRYVTGALTATGGTITTDGSYTVHTFTASSNFVVTAVGSGVIETATVIRSKDSADAGVWGEHTFGETNGYSNIDGAKTSFKVSGTEQASLDSNGAMNLNNPLLNNSTKTVLSGSTSGTATWVMPEQGSGLKKFAIYFDSYVDAGETITFPAPFSAVPATAVNSTGLTIATLTASAITIPVSAGATGWIILEGF